MNRDAALAVGLALLVVVALGVAAATLDSAVDPDADGGFGGGGGEGAGVGPSDEDRPIPDDSPASDTEFAPLVDCQPWLQEPPALAALLGLFGLFFGLTYRDTRSYFASTVVAVALFMPVGLFWYIFAICRDRPDVDDLQLGLLGNQTDEDLLPEAGGASGVGGTVESMSTPTIVLSLLLIVAVLASLALLLTAGRDDEADGIPTAGEDDDEPDPVEVAALGRAAGAAADRIQDDADVDNEVFRAWREMTEPLDVDSPASSTPAEFAAAAVDAGLDRDDVESLTGLFEEVRYGGADATDEREERAVAALRRIEDAYAGGEQ